MPPPWLKTIVNDLAFEGTVLQLIEYLQSEYPDDAVVSEDYWSCDDCGSSSTTVYSVNYQVPMNEKEIEQAIEREQKQAIAAEEYKARSLEMKKKQLVALAAELGYDIEEE